MNWKMKKLKGNGVLYYFAILILFSSCKKNEETQSRVETLPYYNEATFTPIWLDDDDDKLNSFHKIPEFILVNQEGLDVTENTFEDKIYITDFFFTSCPGICTKMTSNMKILQDEFLKDKDVLLLSHSVTPETDSIPILKTYAEMNGVISDKWHLVTGERHQIYNLGRHAYFVEENLGKYKTDDDFLHTENFVLVDKNKHIRGIYNGLNKTSIQQLIADVRTLKKES